MAPERPETGRQQQKLQLNIKAIDSESDSGVRHCFQEHPCEGVYICQQLGGIDEAFAGIWKHVGTFVSVGLVECKCGHFLFFSVRCVWRYGRHGPRQACSLCVKKHTGRLIEQPFPGKPPYPEHRMVAFTHEGAGHPGRDGAHV